MLAAKVQTETGLWDVEPAISSALRPGAMVGSPVAGAILLPAIMTLPGTVP